MTKPNFEDMSLQELREYILEHRNDEDAVHEMVLRIRRNGKSGTVDEFIEHVKQKIAQQQQ
jgi:hypothetical protein